MKLVDKNISEERAKYFQAQNLMDYLVPVISVIAGLIVGAIFMLIIGSDPIEAYKVLWSASFGSVRGFGEMLVNTIPLIFTGMAVAFAFRVGLFNIGGDGQFLVSYLAAAYIGFVFQLPMIIHLPLALLAGILAGGVWGGFAGYLKAKLGIHEVITTIMMNYIALYLVGYLASGPLKADGPLPATPKIFESAKLPRFIPTMRIHYGIFIALGVAFVIYYILWKTSFGYEIRATGQNPDAAEFGGISVARNMLLAMFISGALAGLAGTSQALGLEYRAYQPFGFIGHGFTGIAVALVGKNHPFGVVLGALLFGILSRGAMMMQSMVGVPKEVVEIIQAIIIMFVASEYIFKYISRKMRERKGGLVDAN
jgi:simple sugar transport system permease protein